MVAVFFHHKVLKEFMLRFYGIMPELVTSERIQDFVKTLPQKSGYRKHLKEWAKLTRNAKFNNCV